LSGLFDVTFHQGSSKLLKMFCVLPFISSMKAFACHKASQGPSKEDLWTRCGERAVPSVQIRKNSGRPFDRKLRPPPHWA